MKNNKLIALLSSHILTVAALFFLMLLTVIGTIDQKNIGLFQAQKNYFESIVAFVDVFQTSQGVFKLPIPGGFAVLSLIAVNLIFAMIFKLRRRFKDLGLWVTHLGLILLLVGSLITFMYSKDGYVALFEGEGSTEFTSYHSNELLFSDTSNTKYDQSVAFSEKFLSKKGSFQHPDFGIKLKIQAFYINCKQQKVVPADNPEATPVLQLLAVKPEMQAESNQSGCEVLVLEPDEQITIGKFSVVLGKPFTFKHKDRQYRLLLRRQRYPLPFTIELKKFIRENYPGTEKAKHYQSTVIIKDDNSSRRVEISMNQPLRYQGYTFFQSSFSQDVRLGRYQSILAVVNNPAEKWPYFSCLLIFLGMTIHYLAKLFRFLKCRDAQGDQI